MQQPIIETAAGESTGRRTAFICPVCRRALYRQGDTLCCGTGHRYDMARAGYVNLLQSQRSSDKRHGDDALMVAARTRFLDGGYYDCLLNALADQAVKHAPAGPVTLLDAGCGEGRYTARVAAVLKSAGHDVTAAGVDISRTALAAAHRRDADLQLAVGSVYSLPLASHSCHVVMNVFAPCPAEEYARVLRRRGVLLRAIPLQKHLWELKAAVYDTPYENPAEDPALPGFTLLGVIPVADRIHLPDSRTVQDLFAMTPYYYKTGARDQQKLAALESLDVTLEFGLCVYRKK